MSSEIWKYGLPRLRGTLEHDGAIYALDELVKYATANKDILGGDTVMRMCARDIATYIEQLEAEAKVSTERIAEINRKLDLLIERTRLPGIDE